MIPPNAYRLDGFFMAFVAFTYDLMNGSETWSSMWCSLHIWLNVGRHWLDKRVLMLWLQFSRPRTITPFSDFRCSCRFQKRTDISVFFYFFFHLEFVWEHKKWGPKIFFLLLKGGFIVLLQRISFGYGFLLEEKLLSRRVNVLSWNILNSA